MRTEKPVLKQPSYYIFILCLCLAVWAINIYHNTIIDWKLLIAPSAIGSILSLSFCYKFFKGDTGKEWAAFCSIICGGALFYFAFLFLNKVFAQDVITTGTFDVVKTGTMATTKKNQCATPYVIVEIEGLRKQLMFPCRMSETVLNGQRVTLQFSKGLFGYSIIRHKTILTD